MTQGPSHPMIQNPKKLSLGHCKSRVSATNVPMFPYFPHYSLAFLSSTPCYHNYTPRNPRVFSDQPLAIIAVYHALATLTGGVPPFGWVRGAGAGRAGEKKESQLVTSGWGAQTRTASGGNFGRVSRPELSGKADFCHFGKNMFVFCD